MTLRGICTIRGHTLWLPPLNATSVIIDAGAHAGQFSRSIHQLTGARCLLIEANPELAEKLSFPPPATVLHAALSTADGTASFFLRPNPESGSILTNSRDPNPNSIPIQSISLASLFNRFDLSIIDLLKLDIEGAEFALLQETPSHLLANIRQITVEFHDFLPEFQKRHLVERAVQRLEKIGFVCGNFAFRTHGDVLFINQRHFHLSRIQRFDLKHLARWRQKLHQRLTRSPACY